MNAPIPSRPAPVATDITRPFWDATREHRLVVQQCAACGKAQFFPRSLCTHCMADAPGWIECSGRGHIYTFTINHRAANAHMQDKLPYAVAIVALDEGVRMMANIVDTPLEDIRIGAPVALRWLDLEDGQALPQFALDASAAETAHRG